MRKLSPKKISFFLIVTINTAWAQSGMISYCFCEWSEGCSVVSDSLWPMGYTVHEILQARIQEWVAFPFSRGSSWPRGWTHITGRFLTRWATREAHNTGVDSLSLLQQIFPIKPRSPWLQVDSLPTEQILYLLNFIASHFIFLHISNICVCVYVYSSSVTHSCLTFVTPWTATSQASLSFTISQSLLKFMSIESVMPPKSPLLCCPLLLLPSIFPSIRVFCNESALSIKGPKYWSFSFSISPSSDYSGLISFRIDQLDLLAVQGTLKSLLQHHRSKASVLRPSAFFMFQFSHPYMTTGKKNSFD